MDGEHLVELGQSQHPPGDFSHLRKMKAHTLIFRLAVGFHQGFYAAAVKIAHFGEIENDILALIDAFEKELADGGSVLQVHVAIEGNYQSPFLFTE